MKSTSRSVVFDTDPGMGFPWADVDDNLALLLALSQESIRVDQVSVVCGNVTAEDGVRSISRTLALARRDVPVTIGARRPLVRSYQSGRATLAEIAGPRGARMAYPGEFADGEAVREVPWAYPEHVRLLEQAAAPVTFVCVGPLTNMAFLLQQRPDLEGRIDAIVIMGGALEMRGNISPFAEFNIWVDPEAARIVFDSRVKKVLVPLDVTTTVEISMEEIRAAAGPGDGLAGYMVRATQGWVDALTILSGRPFFNPHDPIALSWLLDPGLFETRPVEVRVEERTGKTTALDTASGSTQACRRVDVPGFTRLFLGSLRRMSQQAPR
ncbi:MAG TPA: nucleoside hydrolase [Spirochaetia bacterium]|nr:nucleoside hydrolase [Spirochaetia bacterium]